MKKYDSSDSLTPRERSIIVGSLLGDANLIRGAWKGIATNARVRFVQGKAQLAYLEWKQQELSRWTSTPIGSEPIKTEYGGHIFRFQTLTHPLFTELYHALYPEGGKIKRITPQIMNWLDDLALAVWFMDDGSGFYSDAKIATYAFTDGDIEAVALLLSQQGMDCKRLQTGKGSVLQFSAAGMRALYGRIAPYVHPTMQYKLGSQEARTCPVCGNTYHIKVVGSYNKQRRTCSASCALKLAHKEYPSNWRLGKGHVSKS